MIIYSNPGLKYKCLVTRDSHPQPGIIPENPGWLAGMFLAIHLRRER